MHGNAHVLTDNHIKLLMDWRVCRYITHTALQIYGSSWHLCCFASVAAIFLVCMPIDQSVEVGYLLVYQLVQSYHHPLPQVYHPADVWAGIGKKVLPLVVISSWR